MWFLNNYRIYPSVNYSEHLLSVQLLDPLVEPKWPNHYWQTEDEPVETDYEGELASVSVSFVEYQNREQNGQGCAHECPHDGQDILQVLRNFETNQKD